VEADLHERIAIALGWTLTETHGFSLRSLRDLVRPVDAELALEITQQIETLARWAHRIAGKRRTP